MMGANYSKIETEVDTVDPFDVEEYWTALIQARGDN
jgi:hypothetical protein